MFRNNKYIRFINQNRGMIILVLGIVIFIWLLIKTISSILQNTNNNEEDTNTNMINTSSSQVKDSQNTILENSSVDTDTAENNYNMISEFVEYCNNGEAEQAYNMISDECKENLYQNMDMFKKNYIQVVFKEKMNIKVNSWTTNREKYTYLISFIGDFLSTGNYTGENEYQDYITVDTKEKKLNINRYIGRKEIGRTQEISNIKFEVGNVDIYKDYEIYNIKISNLNSKQIILDNLNSVSSTYIVTNKGTKVNCSNYEAGLKSFKFDMGVSKTVNLKFIKQYNTDIDDEKLVFSSAILDTNSMDATEKLEVKL